MIVEGESKILGFEFWGKFCFGGKIGKLGFMFWEKYKLMTQ